MEVEGSSDCSKLYYEIMNPDRYFDKIIFNSVFFSELTLIFFSGRSGGTCSFNLAH